MKNEEKTEQCMFQKCNMKIDRKQKYHRNQIARQLRTQYVEGMPIVTMWPWNLGQGSFKAIE